MFSKSGCPEDSNMDSRRCNLRCEKKKPDPKRGRTRTGGTMVALSPSTSPHFKAL